MNERRFPDDDYCGPSNSSNRDRDVGMNIVVLRRIRNDVFRSESDRESVPSLLAEEEVKEKELLQILQTRRIAQRGEGKEGEKEYDTP